MARNYGVNDINAWKFKKIDLPAHWAAHFGNLPERFLMIIEGKSGHGKTEYNGQLVKLFTDDGKRVHWNNMELGKAASFSEMWERQGLRDMKPGYFSLAGKHLREFDAWVEFIRRSNSKIIFLDSIDAMKLTFDQWKALTDRFKHRSFVMNCWNDPMSAESKKIKYLCDIKVEVNNFQAKIRSRYGGGQPHIIWPEGYTRETGKKVPKTTQLSLL